MPPPTTINPSLIKAVLAPHHHFLHLPPHRHHHHHRRRRRDLLSFCGSPKPQPLLRFLHAAGTEARGSVTEPNRNALNNAPHNRKAVAFLDLTPTQVGSARRRCWSAMGLRSPATAEAAATSGDAVGSGNRCRGEEGDGRMNGGLRKEDKEERRRTESSRLLTLPTVLTLGRVAAIPLLVSTFYMDVWWATTATTSIFLGAAITDWLDGYIARKMRLRTTFGAFLDPVADKLMVSTTLLLLCSKPLEIFMGGDMPWLLTVPSIAIIGREITMSAVREWAASQNSRLLEAVAVNNLGKWKTATQLTALAILLLSRDPSLTGQSPLVASGVALLYISSGLAVWSLAVYIKKIWKVLLK